MAGHLTAPASQSSWVQIPFMPEFFQAFLGSFFYLSNNYCLNPEGGGGGGTTPYNVLCPFGTINLKSWLPGSPPFSACYQIIPPVPI